MGSTGAAALGGYLAEPAGRVPVFGQISLFERYPYILPGLVMAVLSVMAAAAVLLLVPEVSTLGVTKSIVKASLINLDQQSIAE